MNRRSLLLTILSLTAAGITGAQAQTNSSNLLFQNGNMGSFSGGVPTGWNMQGSGANSAQSSVNSPFTNAYADNSSSWTMTRSGAGGGGGSQGFSSVNYTNITVNFDFMVTTLTTGDTPWGIQFDGAGASAVPSSSVHYRIDKNGQFAINAGTGGTSSVINNILQLEAGAWYNVQANFQVTAINTGTANGAGFQSGTITKQGGSLSQSWNNVATLGTTLGYSRLLIYDRSGAGGNDKVGSLYVDNVSVVPEPSEYALMALGLGITTLVILRRRKEGQAS
jgi:hypothetical protein